MSQETSSHLQTITTHLSSDHTKQLAAYLFKRATPEFFASFSSEQLAQLSQQGLEFIQQRQNSEVKVRVRGVNGYTVLEFLLKDRPFIVDSVKMELDKQGLELKYFLHPILPIVRNQQRELTAFDPEGELEAYELYFLAPIDESTHDALEQRMERILHDVRHATKDFGAMRGKVTELSALVMQRENSRAKETQRREYADFLQWLDKDNFVFLGYREYDIVDLDGQPAMQIAQGSELGILRENKESGYLEPRPLEQIPEAVRQRILEGDDFLITKTNSLSTVHRPARLDYIGIKKIADGKIVGERRFLGLFTSKALSTAVEHIPLLRLKLEQVLERDGVVKGSHDYKEIVTIFNSIPREELFRADVAQLHEDIRSVMNVVEDATVMLKLQPDPLKRGVSAMVLIPRERFSADIRRKVQDFLGETFQAEHIDYNLAMGEEEKNVRMHFFFNTSQSMAHINHKELEESLAEMTKGWHDSVKEKLIAKHGEVEGQRLHTHYAHAFNDNYKNDTPANVAILDIERFDKLGDDDFLAAIVQPLDDRYGEGATHLKIYHQDRTLVLSQVLPLLETLGLRVIEQISYYINEGKDERGLDIFRVQTKQGEMLDIEADSERLITAIDGLLRNTVEKDNLNQLVLYGGLSVREVSLLRCYRMHYAQINLETSQKFITQVLVQYPEASRLLFDAFANRFQPEVAEREQKHADIKEKFADVLNTVPSLTADRTLRGLMNLIEATVRSNFYRERDYIANKVASHKVTAMPEPRPFMEIAMYHPRVEGIHLRGGMVARGGLRWSDRPDDFRTEVLGLMKTQMTKNAVIVPVGSKGGFVLKQAPSDRAALRDYGKEQYKVYINALLDVTDNIVDGQVVQPPITIYDGEDPYLVVAADKGTATFSDVANSISLERNFWLGDAFASGGSNGYDHKAEGITARGAWVCVERHFRELGINPHEDVFTAAGIGDMGGDVFGNGMIHTDKMKLLAAFNHIHIFLDPNPEPTASYAERQRMFNLPRSTWEDYDPSLISEGGGVFSRQAKAIDLSPQAQAMLGVSESTMSGQDIIKAILTMEVDLLWNGGIGTYVKSSTERHGDVGDASNDTVRIDADDLRARIVGEGGNLGFTQRARIEYNLQGGRINTDAIDNSGGVDMSDHEVNIKIAMQPLLKAGELDDAQRNALLEQMTDAVSELVLADNYNQSLALSLAERQSAQDISIFQSLQHYMREESGLNPEVEFLPDAKSYAERARNGQGLSRPELAILLAYAKMGLYGWLLEADVDEQNQLSGYLQAYFPQLMQDELPSAIENHSLRREIIATQFTNRVIDLLGITFMHRLLRNTGASSYDIVKSALVAMHLVGAHDFLQRVKALDYQIDSEAQYWALERMRGTVEHIVPLLLANPKSLDDIVSSYQQPLEEFRQVFPELEQVRAYHGNLAQAQKAGFDDATAEYIATLDYFPGGLGIVTVALESDKSIEDVAKHYYEVGERLNLEFLHEELDCMQVEDKWGRIAFSGTLMDLYKAQRRLTRAYVASDGELEDYLQTHHTRLIKQYDGMMAELQAEEQSELASVQVLVRILLEMVG